MKYLNLGCGIYYSTQEEWTNLDFVSSGNKVLRHNLLNGIPFEDNTFDAVYHSHVLEHFTKEDGEAFTAECFRVLKPGGVLRIVLPDLEGIMRNYIQSLDNLAIDPNDEIYKANYEWMLLEMYDQTVRNYGGGNMGKYLFQKHIKNEDFIFARIGEEGRQIRKKYFESRDISVTENKKFVSKTLIRTLRGKIKGYLLKKLRISKVITIGNFRLKGEIHQWMYDRYSLTELLNRFGGESITVTDAYTSSINNWSTYKLDVIESGVRKPDSLFIEAIK